MSDLIDCMNHGRRATTFVCQHVAGSLLTRRPVGFFWSAADSKDFPDAWCAECNERHARSGLEWVGEALEHLDAKVLCSGCYLEARRMCLGR
jgi:hypothetical protein